MKLCSAGSLALAIFISSCSYFPLQPASTDCGFLASYRTPEPDTNAWISISRVLAEAGNGQSTCGSRHAPTRADKAFVDGTQLEVKTIGEDVLYVAPVGFDPATNSFSIEVDGRGYIADPNNVRRVGDRNTIGLRPFPSK